MYKAGILILLLASLWQWLVILSRPSPPSNALLSKLRDQFEAEIERDDHLTITNRGALRFGRRTFLWNYFSKNFASNPNTPYMYNALPLIFPGGILPSPMWRLKHGDATVLLFQEPPAVDYFSFTPFCLWSRKRGFVFASLGDTLDHVHVQSVQARDSIVEGESGADKPVWAHVVVTQRSRQILERIQQILLKSGIRSLDYVHVAVVPNTLIDEDQLAVFEVVLRIFRFHNQTLGDSYLESNQPVFYVEGERVYYEGKSTNLLSMPKYKDRGHKDSIDEWKTHGKLIENQVDSKVKDIKNLYEANVTKIDFSPLYILGLDCIEKDGSKCLGDCPDAAYLGSNIDPNQDMFPSLSLKDENEFHLAVSVDHRQLKSAIYSSIALLKTPSEFLNKTSISARATSVGIISNKDYYQNITSGAVQMAEEEDSILFSWLFTRNSRHCQATFGLVHGCTVLDENEIPRTAHLAYCERLYFDTITQTGPDWDKIIPARLYHFQDLRSKEELNDPIYRSKNADFFSKLRLPESDKSMVTFRGEEKLRFLHIIKTGGESLERYLRSSPTIVPKIDYDQCKNASTLHLQASRPFVAKTSCWLFGTIISSALCGLNCECCASELYERGRFHGTMLRSPRAHTLSLFSHGHTAHHSTWKRMAHDPTLFLAEAGLRITEHSCGHAGTGGVRDWKQALENTLRKSLSAFPIGQNDTDINSKDEVHVISLRNTQSHSLTCGKASKGSFGQHLRVLHGSMKGSRNENVDFLEPDLNQSLAAIHNMEWIGITDLYHPSLCLLHYQANQSLPMMDCDCRNKHHFTNDRLRKPLGHWIETRSKRRSVNELSPEIVEMIDDHTTIDQQVFEEALKVFLSRLRRVEEVTGASILECIDWLKLKEKTHYMTGLWQDSKGLLPDVNIHIVEEDGIVDKDETEDLDVNETSNSSAQQQ